MANNIQSYPSAKTEYMRKWRSENPGKHTKYMRGWRAANLEKNNAYNRSYRKMRRLEAINHYGGKCKCCGEDHYEFLSIDHIDGGGTHHRKELGKRGANFWQWLKDNGWPSGYQVLCHNCNQAKGYHGFCPHERSAIQNLQFGLMSSLG